MSAPYGNRNAEKWNFRKAVKLFNDAIKLSEQKEMYDFGIGGKKEGYSFDFIGEVAGELGTYHQMITQHLPERFKSLERLKKQLINNLERNCYINTKKGMIKEATGIVNLKSNHKWTDRTQQELTGKNGEPLFKEIKGITFVE